MNAFDALPGISGIPDRDFNPGRFDLIFGGVDNPSTAGTTLP